MPARGSSSKLKLLGTSQDMQIVDDGTSAEIKEILAQAAITGASSLPLTHMSQGMLNGYSFAQLSAALRSLLALA